MWAALAVALGAFLLAIAGLNGHAPRAVGIVSLAIFPFGLGLAVWFSLTDHRARMAAREQQSRAAILAMLAVQLQGQDDAALRKLAGKRGLVGQAAAMLIKGRQQKGSPH
jgi:hypothetical protein